MVEWRSNMYTRNGHQLQDDELRKCTMSWLLFRPITIITRNTWLKSYLCDNKLRNMWDWYLFNHCGILWLRNYDRIINRILAIIQIIVWFRKRFLSTEKERCRNANIIIWSFRYSWPTAMYCILSFTIIVSCNQFMIV